MSEWLVFRCSGSLTGNHISSRRGWTYITTEIIVSSRSSVAGLLTKIQRIISKSKAKLWMLIGGMTQAVNMFLKASILDKPRPTGHATLHVVRNVVGFS